MFSLLPAFVGGMPGGMELVIIFFIMVLLFGIPVVLALFLGYRYVRGQSASTEKDERISELESELAELREQVESTTHTGEGTADSDGPGPGVTEGSKGDGR